MSSLKNTSPKRQGKCKPAPARGDNGTAEVLDLLKKIALACFGQENYPTALKALELWGKELGLFAPTKKAPEAKRLSDFTTQELKNLLEKESGT